MQDRRIVGLLLLGALALGGCGGQEGSGSPPAPATREGSTVGSDFSPVLARVSDQEITQSFFDFRYESLPPSEKARYSGEGWRERFLGVLIEEALLYADAREEKVDKIPEVQRRLETQAMRTMVSAYYDRHYVTDVEVPEERIAEAYELYKDEYRTPDKLVAHHIRCSSKETIDDVYRQLQEGGRFDMLALKHSEDEESRQKGGMIGWIDRDGYVPNLGFNKKFSDVIFGLERGGWSEPVEIDGSWHILMAGMRKEGEQQTLEQVHDQVLARVRPLVAKEKYAEDQKRLAEHFGVSRFGEFQEDELRTAEQLYEIASESTNPHARIYYYETLVDKYPAHERADDALFMAGFLHSEEFGEVAQASAAFRKLRIDYPQSEFVDEAEWMTKHMGRAEPELRGDVSPRDPVEVRSRMDGIRREGGGND